MRDGGPTARDMVFGIIPRVCETDLDFPCRFCSSTSFVVGIERQKYEDVEYMTGEWEFQTRMYRLDVKRNTD